MKLNFTEACCLFKSRKKREAGSACALKILLRERRVRRLGFPEDADYPPTLAVVHQLYAVDAARERLRVIGLVSALVCAPGVGDLGRGIDAARDPFFVENL